MQQRLIGTMAGLLMLAWAQSALALSERLDVTPATQVEQGLAFTLTTTPGQDNMLNVQIKIPKKGKLKNLTGLHLELSDKDMMLWWSPLATTEQNGIVAASLQISNYLMPGCYINLFVVDRPRDHIDYAGRLKDYIPDPDK